MESTGLVDIAGPSGPVGSPAASGPAPRPWPRYWARLIDNFSFSFVFGLVLGFVAPAFLELPAIVLNALGVAAWMPVEAALLSTVGTTGGKWLLRVALTRSSGQPVDFATALQRSFGVWWRGMGLGIPIVTLITLLMSHSQLTNHGITQWDKDGGFEVRQGEIGIVRGAIAAAFILLFTWIAAAAQMGSQGGFR